MVQNHWSFHLRSENDTLIVSYSGPMYEDYVNSMVTAVRLNQEPYESYLFDINTNGGHSDAAMLISTLIEDLKPKPVGVISRRLLSAGVLATLNADFIMSAGEFGEFGSIGVYQQLPLFLRGYINKNFITLKPKTSKDKNKSFDKWIKDGSTDGFMDSLEKFDELFMSQVKKHRPITDANVLQGGVYMSQDAKMVGLIDYIGSEKEAIKKLNKLKNRYEHN